ncbi:MAG TPA: N-methyl-L-tryptophan oxidase [Blastocatellia bacterium]|nr:N-methyl-L-tryptophan oxidase [Blastocatellia bacterium]
MQNYDVVIIGGGVMGAAAACEVAARGARTAIVDRTLLPNARAASIDHSKVFRFAYPDLLYIRMAVESLALWRKLEYETGERLLTETGLLMIGHSSPSVETATYRILRAEGLEAEMLTAAETEMRFPQFNGAALSYSVFDPSGAILHAETVVRALLRLAEERGVELIEGEAVTSIESESGEPVYVATETGKEIECGCALVASGPWTRGLLPELDDVLYTTRQEVLYFKPASGDSSFDVSSFPIFFDPGSGFYGFPVHHAGAMKIANHNKGEPADPDSRNDHVSLRSIGECRAFFADLSPGLAGAEMVETRVCFYNNTPDDDFIIDWHPELDNVLIATGFSGHGFKFSSLVGRICAELLSTSQTVFDIERFRLARFGAGLRESSLLSNPGTEA